MMVVLNKLLPMVGLLICLYVLLCQHINTKRADIGAFMHLSVVIWLMLLWADWGDDFVPVVSTVIARMIVLAMDFLMVSVILRRSIKEAKNEY